MSTDKGVNDLGSYGEGCLFEEPFDDIPSVERSSEEIPEFLKRVEVRTAAEERLSAQQRRPHLARAPHWSL